MGKKSTEEWVNPKDKVVVSDEPPSTEEWLAAPTSQAQIDVERDFAPRTPQFDAEVRETAQRLVDTWGPNWEGFPQDRLKSAQAHFAAAQAAKKTDP